MNRWCLVVTGPPCSGKSYLAKHVARAFGLPSLSKDDLKEALFDALGWDDPLLAQRYNAAAYELLFLVLGRWMCSGGALLAESNFRAELDAGRLKRLASDHGYQLLQVHVSAAPEVLMARFRERWEGGERHPGHADDFFGDRIAKNIAQERYGILDLAGPLIRVDTTDLAQVDLGLVVARISALTGWPSDQPHQA